MTEPGRPERGHTERGRTESVDWLRWALAGFAVLVTVAGLASALGSVNDRPPGLVGWLLAPALGLPLLLIGHRPMLTLLLSVVLVFTYYASGRAPIGFELPLSAACVNAAERGRIRPAAVVAAAGVGAAYLTRIRFTGQHLQILGVQFLTSAVVLTGALACGEAIRVRNAWRGELARRHQLELAAQRAALLGRVESQRRALARDIHDVLAHTLVVVGQQAALAGATLESRPDQARAALGLVSSTVRGARSEVRDALRLLRTDETESRAPTAGLADLPALVDGFAGRVTVESDVGPLPPLGAAVDSTAYRIVQEALTNVHRHSDARLVQVQIGAADDRLRLRITDDGHPVASLVPGSGIRGMTERAELLGGRLRVEAGPDGVTVRADLPIGAHR